MQNGVRQTPRAQAVQRFFALFYRLNTLPTTRANLHSLAFSSLSARYSGQQELFPSHLKQPDKKGRRGTRLRARQIVANSKSFTSSGPEDSVPRKNNQNVTKSDTGNLVHSRGYDGSPEPAASPSRIRYVRPNNAQKAGASASPSLTDLEGMRRKMTDLSQQLKALRSESTEPIVSFESVPQTAAGPISERTAAFAEKRRRRRERRMKARLVTSSHIKDQPEVSLEDYMRHIYAQAPDAKEDKKHGARKLTGGQGEDTVSPGERAGIDSKSSQPPRSAVMPENLSKSASLLEEDHQSFAEDTEAPWGSLHADLPEHVSTDHAYGTVAGAEVPKSALKARINAMREKIQSLQPKGGQAVDNSHVADDIQKPSQAGKPGKWDMWDSPEQGDRLRSLMRSVPSSVVVVTTCAPGYDKATDRTNQLRELNKHKKIGLEDNVDPDYRGMAVSSFTTVSMSDKPVISFNIKTPSRTLDGLKHWQQFYVHIFDGTKEAAKLASAFTQGDPTSAFRNAVKKARIEHPFPPVSGEPDPITAPRLYHGSIVATLFCKILKTVTVADHEVVFATVRLVSKGGSWKREEGGDVAAELGTLLYHDRQYKSVGGPLYHPTASDGK